MMLSLDPPWDPALDGIVSHDNGEDFLTPYFIYGTNAALPLLFALVLIGRAIFYLRRRALARKTEGDADLAFTAGDRVVHGQVVNVEAGGSSSNSNSNDGNGKGPVKITIIQHGISFEHKGKSGKTIGWTTKWTETSRVRHAVPFILRTADGREVRVYPDERFELLDELEDGAKNGPERERIAKLDEGENVYAFGSLSEELDSRGAGAGTYRGGGKSWVLRAPRGRPMMLSVGRMSHRFAGDARLSAVLASVLVVFVLFVQALSLPYHFALWRGHAEPAAVVGVKVIPKKKKSPEMSELTFRRLATSQELTVRISDEDQPLFTTGRIIPIHVVRFMGEDRITIGARATAEAALSLVPCAFSFLLMGVATWLLLTIKQWYERKRVVDKTDGKIA